MANRETIRFPEFTQKYFELTDGGELPPTRSIAGKVIRRLQKVEKLSAEIHALQQGCDHPHVVNLAPVRRLHQCMACGLVRFKAFGP